MALIHARRLAGLTQKMLAGQKLSRSHTQKSLVVFGFLSADSVKGFHFPGNMVNVFSISGLVQLAHTVDGSEIPKNHLGCLKTLENNGINYRSQLVIAGQFLSESRCK